MDKFDDLLKEIAKDEKENFNLPKSFENRIDQTLNTLDRKKTKRQWYNDKKILSMVAGLAFVILVGVGVRETGIKKSNSPQVASESSILRDSQDNGVAENYNTNSRAAIDINNVQNLTIKILGEVNKYKSINQQRDIIDVINLLNGLQLIETYEDIGEDWDFFIQFNGTVNSSVLIKDNIINFDDTTYQIMNWNKADFIELYNRFKYEEKDIKYCPTE